MSLIPELLCEMLFGHRLGTWTPYEVPEAQYARFEYAKCRICRTSYVRPQRLLPLPEIDPAT